jgi:hypothetical protein
MPEAAAILARLDAIMRELAELRTELVASMPVPAADGNGLDSSDDFAPEHPIEISTAVEHFNRPANSIRWMCRRQACGVKVGGRWMASSPRPLR